MAACYTARLVELTTSFAQGDDPEALEIARSLIDLNVEFRTALKRAGLLTRDAREKESKKYGLKKARKAPQYSKR